MYDKHYLPRQFSSAIVTPGAGSDSYHHHREGERPFPALAKFLVGGMAGTTAAFLVHPLDFLKTRMQMTGVGLNSKFRASAMDIVTQIYRNEGLTGFYNGGSACLLKQSVYTTVRLGMYTNLSELLSDDDKKPSFTTKIMAGTFAGMCSGVIATPLDVCLVRMMYDGCKPRKHQFKYRNPFDALNRIACEEKGFKGLYRGVVPTTLRAGVVGIGLATYSQIKQCFKSNFDMEEGLKLHFWSSMLSGLLAAVVTMPFDLIKTRTQSVSTREKRLLSMLKDIVRNEGGFAFWKGFLPYYARIAPITVLTFIFVEQLSYLYSVYVLGNKKPKSNL